MTKNKQVKPETKMEKTKKTKRRLNKVKNLVKFLKDRRGVSPVIGVILMVAITVVLGAVVAGFVYGYIGTTTKAPNVVLSAVDNPTNTNSLLIKHNGGESISASDWKLAVSSGKDSAGTFETASSADDSGGEIGPTDSANISTGTVLNVYYQTNGTSGSGTAISSGNWYHVTIVHIPTDSLLLDTNVLVR